ncbi:helix-turn-helix domain-containing protein [Kocuria rhizophila]|uniref:helix-turn-helix domain-containing protein n=1 Tax=Kocuria rhizophila TaxID=72000 RepID=UPI001EF696B2|nr:helix-turn-helix domain-containing protein [Kocuria rhizophila]
MRPINPEQLRRRRLASGFTQYELAALCKCSQAAISGLETGNLKQCSEDLARVMCKWLGRDMDELFVVSPTSSKTRVLNAKGVKHAPAMAA